MAQLDSQKLEKLLSSATNERQRKMYQALLKKARSQKPAGTNSSSGTEKKKIEEETPIFQAFGQMVLTPYLKENDLKVEINGEEYELLYSSNATFIAHRRLKEVLTSRGSSKMLLKLYPNVQLSNKSESIKLSFILGGFESKYDPNLEYPEKFILKGIWQYILKSQKPVISIYRNINQLEEFKKLNEIEESKLVKLHHIPIVWKNAPVAPFKYIPEVEKEEQMPRYFVEVSAIIKDGIYLVQEMLKEPTLDIPTHIKAEKLKEYILENKFSFSENSNNSEIPHKKIKSLSKKEKFQFVLRGKVLRENESEVFQLENGTKFNVKRIIPLSYPQEIADWQVVLVTDNAAQVVNLILKNPWSSTELKTTAPNLIIEAANVMEISQKNDRIKVKVERKKTKDLKIALLGVQPKMQVGQLWSMKLSLKEGYLHIQEAQYLKN